MSRNNERSVLVFDSPAAAAGTSAVYHAGVDRPFLVKGFSWFWVGAEGNADNTIDFSIDYEDGSGSFSSSVFTNGNAFGLADTGVALKTFDKMGSAATAGGAAQDVSSSFGISNNLRVPAGRTMRVNVTRAGTGTIPRVVFTVYGTYL